MTIRRARLTDAAELSRLNVLFNGAGVSTADETAAALSEHTGEVVFVAEADDRLIGFICGRVLRSFCYKDFSAEITELYVEPGARRKGAASLLMAEMEKHLSACGAKEIHLYTGAQNRAAQAFYERAGYQGSMEIQYHK